MFFPNPASGFFSIPDPGVKKALGSESGQKITRQEKKAEKRGGRKREYTVYTIGSIRTFDPVWLCVWHGYQFTNPLTYSKHAHIHSHKHTHTRHSTPIYYS
jgi:hypothetical protein